MILSCHSRNKTAPQKRSAFTLVETLLGSVMTVIVFGALLVAIAYGFGVMHASSENNRATQILLDRMEGIRLYTWNQLVSSNMLSTEFEATFEPAAGTNIGSGIVYHGSLLIADAALDPAPSYSADLRRVTVTVTWTNNGALRRRSMSTFVARNGVQNHVRH